MTHERRRAASMVVDLITGLWRSQILHAGVVLGIFDALSSRPARDAISLASDLEVGSTGLYRLLRALGNIDLLVENREHAFTLTAAGELLTTTHPQSLRGMVRLEAGFQHYSAWRHLPELVRLNQSDGFGREFGVNIFELQNEDTEYAQIFHEAMFAYSASETDVVTQLVEDVNIDGVNTICDVGGGHGHLLERLLSEWPAVSGIVLDLPAVVADQQNHLRPPEIQRRCQYVSGDMFASVPRADVYFLKHVLHDWNEEECLRILSTIRRAASARTRLFICEWIVPEPDTPHFSKIVDIHMLCISTGRQRTIAEFNRLLTASGWKTGRFRQGEAPLGVLEAAVV